MRAWWPLLLAVLILSPSVAGPVILDTDIGDDIDDTWALTLILRSPELDLKLVNTDFGRSVYRAKIVAKMLETAGRTDVGVGLGLKQGEGEGGQAAWVADYDLAKYPGKVYQDGVQAMIDTIMASPVPITIIAIGPPPSLAAALAREPKIATKARVVGMFGSLRKGYGGSATPQPEWNVKGSAAAAKAVLSAPWDVTITPLDTCGVVSLQGGAYAALRGSSDPLVQMLITNYRIWSGKDAQNADRGSSTLFDTVAVYLACSTDLCTMEDLGVTVTDDGLTKIDPNGKVLHCAMAWKGVDGYYGWLVRRLLGAK